MVDVGKNANLQYQDKFSTTSLKFSRPDRRISYISNISSILLEFGQLLWRDHRHFECGEMSTDEGNCNVGRK